MATKLTCLKEEEAEEAIITGDRIRLDLPIDQLALWPISFQIIRIAAWKRLIELYGSNELVAGSERPKTFR